MDTKTTVSKAAETAKTETKAAVTTATATTASATTAAKPAAPAAKKPAAKKPAAKKPAAKKPAAKKPAAKPAAKSASADKKPAATAKKAPAKKAAPKRGRKPGSKNKVVESVQETIVQVDGVDIAVAETLVERVKEAYKNSGHRVGNIKSLRIYINVNDRKAYYVINDKADDNAVIDL
ncbi:MAG: hypothetical protein J5819_02455 [Eubacterium sp.]|nr:hypothetical protein [Eubacterium sp.]